MQIGPGADEDGVGVGGGDELLPIVINGGDGELLGYALGRLPGAIAEADYFHAFDGLEAGDVAGGSVFSGTDDSDANFLLRGYPLDASGSCI